MFFDFACSLIFFLVFFSPYPLLLTLCCFGKALFLPKLLQIQVFFFFKKKSKSSTKDDRLGNLTCFICTTCLPVLTTVNANHDGGFVLHLVPAPLDLNLINSQGAV